MASGTEIFRLFGSILIDSSEAEKSLGKTDSSAKKVQESLGKVVSGAAKFAAGAAASITAAGAAVFKFADSVASVGDNIDKQSQKLGISAKSYQEWDAVLGHCGASIDSLKGGMKTLTKAIADGSSDQVAAFEAVGLSMDQVASMSTEDVFSAVITGLQGMEEGADRTNIATTLLGKSAQELGPLLNTSAEDTASMKQAVNELGGVMSDDAVAASASFKDALQDLTTIGTGFKNALGEQVMPYVTEAMTALTDGFRENGIIGMANAAVEIVSDFAGKIVTEIPRLASSAAQMITGLTGYLESHMDDILNTGGTLVMNLASALIQNVPQLLIAGAKLLLAIVRGILEHLPEVGDAAGEIGKKLIAEMSDLAQKALDWGKDLVDNLIKGIKDKVSAVGDAAKEVAGSIATFLHHTTPDEGPLAGDDQWMPEMMQQFVDGITQGIPALQAAAEEAADGVAAPFSELSSKISGLISNGPIGSVKNLFTAVKNGDWGGIGKFVAESVYNGMTEDQKTWTGNTITGWLNALNDAYSTGGWQSVFQLGSSVASTLSATLQQQSGTILAAGSQWLSGITEKISASLPVLGDLAGLLGKSLFSGITAFFPSLFTAIGSVVGTIGTALTGVISAVIATLSAIPIAGWALAAVAAAGLAALLVTLSKTQSDLNQRGASTDIDATTTKTPSPSEDAPVDTTPRTDPGKSDTSDGSGNGQTDNGGEPTPGVTVVQYIYTNTDATASDLMREALWEAERGALVGL